MTPVKAVIFDFDGTLADTAADMIAALNRWLAVRGRAAVEADKVRDLCSGGSRALLNYCGIGDENIDDAVEEYLQYYEETAYRQTVLFAGVEGLLSALTARGIAWAVATNKPQKYFMPIADRLLTALQPAALICRNGSIAAKPAPDMLLAAAGRYQAAECVYVGDDVRDGIAAGRAAMPFIAVTWGYWVDSQWQDNPPPIAAIISQPELLLNAIGEGSG